MLLEKDEEEKWAVYEDTWKTNRDRAKEAKRGLGWCDGCDANYLPMTYGKCPSCGWKYIGRLKKNTSAR